MKYFQVEQKRIPIEKLIEHPERKGFYQTPSSPLLYIGENGLCWDEDRQIYLKPSFSNGKYPTIRHLGKNWNLHSLLGKTFLVKPEIEGEIWINHRNGNKENFHLTNLEWTSASQNLLHAFENGLRTDNKSVKLKDLKNGSVIEFTGLNACARFLNKAPSVLSMYLGKKSIYPFIGRYELRWVKDDWVGFQASDVGKVRQGVSRGIIVEHLESRQKVIYRSVAVAAENIGIKRSKIAACASGKRNSDIKNYRFTWLDEFVGLVDGIPVISPMIPPRKNRNFIRKPKKILVRNIITGQEETWDSSESFSEHLGVKKTCLQAAVLRKNGRFRNYHVSYL